MRAAVREMRDDSVVVLGRGEGVFSGQVWKLMAADVVHAAGMTE